MLIPCRDENKPRDSVVGKVGEEPALCPWISITAGKERETTARVTDGMVKKIYNETFRQDWFSLDL